MSASPSPSPASSSGPVAQVPGGGGSGHPAPLRASFSSTFHSSANAESAAAHDTGSGYGSLRRRDLDSASHCFHKATESWSAASSRPMREFLR